MKKFALTALVFTALFSCKSRKIENADTLPKDIALKSDNALSQQAEQEKLTAQLNTIKKRAVSETCADAAMWEIAPVGAKPCGGPAFYMAIPKNSAAELLSMIADYTALQKEFNLRYKLMSDCGVVAEPSGIRCEQGKAVLIQ